MFAPEPVAFAPIRVEEQDYIDHKWNSGSILKKLALRILHACTFGIFTYCYNEYILKYKFSQKDPTSLNFKEKKAYKIRKQILRIGNRTIRIRLGGKLYREGQDIYIKVSNRAQQAILDAVNEERKRNGEQLPLDLPSPYPFAMKHEARIPVVSSQLENLPYGYEPRKIDPFVPQPKKLPYNNELGQVNSDSELDLKSGYIVKLDKISEPEHLQIYGQHIAEFVVLKVESSEFQRIRRFCDLKTEKIQLKDLKDRENLEIEFHLPIGQRMLLDYHHTQPSD